MVDSNTFELNTWDVTDSVNSSGNNAWYTRLDDDCDDNYVSITNAILVLERRAVGESDLAITAIKPYHYAWSEEEGIPKGEPWFNLMNYVNITVNNIGTEVVDNFAVTLYADDELIGSEIVEGLSAGGSKDVKIEWVPDGEDPLRWTDTAEGAVYFNGVELGRGVYCGYASSCNRTVDGITMNVGAADAQVGVNVTLFGNKL
jgi:hypothetical protein